MEKFTVHSGIAAPLKHSNVDTDQIIPAVHLKRVTRHGYEDALFSAWRDDPEFVLNHPVHGEATILVAGPDFGTGSSREHAVWALQDYGFKVVLSSRFADIFRGNSGKGGLLTAEVDHEVIEAIWELLDADPATEITIDLHEKRVIAGNINAPFEIDDYVRWRLLEGLDDIGITLKHVEAVDAFETSRPSHLPTTI
jgi:3-isopropylmalate/(R)-2-methylmalate dehydratase small subunit